VSWTVGLTLAGRFRLDAALGASSNPRVWAATHLPTGRRVALRRLELPPGLPPRALAQLVAEVRSASAVEHPNVAELYELIEGLDDAPLMVSELLRGETLERKLTQHPMLSLRETASLLLPVVSAVGTAHARGIVHGGLSASSVFLWGGMGAVPAVKVLNFGLAKWVAALERAPASTRGGAPASRRTSEYEPPELDQPGRIIDHRADIWALGIILYECLSGQRPRDFVAREPELAASAAFEPIDHRAPAVPRAISDIIAHLLVSDPDHRAQNLIELFHALSPLAERPSPNFGWPGSERRISGLTQRLIAPDRLAAAQPTPVPQSPARVNWRTLALAATSLAALELVAIAWLLFRAPSGSSPLASIAPEPPPPAESIVALNAAPSTVPNAAASLAAAPEGAAVTARAGELLSRVDDFEDGNAAPLAEAFGNWQSFTVNPAGRDLPLRLGPGHDSRGSVEMQWLLEDVLDAKDGGRAGAGMRSAARAGVVDLSRHSRVTFAHHYAPTVPPGLECRGAADFVVFVTCRSLAEDAVPQLEYRVPVSDAWAVASIELGALQDAAAGSSPPTDPKACLAAADSFGFRADAASGVDSGGCDSGTLWIDDIGFL
jgi:eukaryotic-like serine/threonine-protein kinase